MKEEKKKNKRIEAEHLARERVARMLLMLRDVVVVSLFGGVIWPLGTFTGGQLVKNRAGRFHLVGATCVSDGKQYDKIELPVEAVAAALIGDHADDDLDYDTVHLQFDSDAIMGCDVTPRELEWWTEQMRDKVLELNGMEIDE